MYGAARLKLLRNPWKKKKQQKKKKKNLMMKLQ
ncbi:heat shock protein 90 beta family member 1 [Rhinolophus ferrumequinum]|uniref:Heat shock protein 90 beta family member 1 n=2 Tax=Chiroptera TaxID=9397 RepID=A0A7J7WQG7_RHIFE|nr:heat shock protein 90 beta family member 1 [Rhinolophus ferrumequinum]KAF6373871.1 heat shock protein 90 beta family member 1 [Pipistrellus kuhlii]